MELYGIGNTNLVSRPTRNGAELSKSEMINGVVIVEKKVRTFRPEAVCIVGKGIWETVFRVKTRRALKKEEFKYGCQEEGLWLGREKGEGGWKGARTFVATSTSGLAAGMSYAEKLEVWRELGEWFEPKRMEWVRMKGVEVERQRSGYDAGDDDDAGESGDDEYIDGYKDGYNDGLMMMAGTLMAAKQAGLIE